MKKKLIFLSILIFILYILMFPREAVAAAAGGLTLWYERVLPSLLPFSIVSNILIYSNYLAYLTKYLYPLTGLLLPGSRESSFVIISGFLFGFPMGSKNCAELLKCGNISDEEAGILFIITNNISPVFISSYILSQELRRPSLIGISYLVLFLPPLAAGMFFLRRLKKAARPKERPSSVAQKRPASESQMNFKIIDAGIMNGFETLTRLGGYIMLFSVFASMLNQLPLPVEAKVILTGAAEITNGIHRLQELPLSPSCQYVLAMAFTAFGGLSGIAQTSSMVKGTSLSMKRYVFLKLAFTAASTLLACLAVQFLSA